MGKTSERGLVAAMGNSGPRYAANRHNARHMVADVLAAVPSGIGGQVVKQAAAALPPPPPPGTGPGHPVPLQLPR